MIRPSVLIQKCVSIQEPNPGYSSTPSPSQPAPAAPPACWRAAAPSPGPLPAPSGATWPPPAAPRTPPPPAEGWGPHACDAPGGPGQCTPGEGGERGAGCDSCTPGQLAWLCAVSKEGWTEDSGPEIQLKSVDLCSTRAACVSADVTSPCALTCPGCCTCCRPRDLHRWRSLYGCIPTPPGPQPCAQSRLGSSARSSCLMVW